MTVLTADFFTPIFSEGISQADRYFINEPRLSFGRLGTPRYVTNHNSISVGPPLTLKSTNYLRKPKQLCSPLLITPTSEWTAME
jgi:hypothetical protein